jgi:hypothetical protein
MKLSKGLKLIKKFFTRRNIKADVESGIEPNYPLTISGKTYFQQVLGFEQFDKALLLAESLISEISEDEFNNKVSKNKNVSIGSLISVLRNVISSRKNEINKLFQILYRTEDKIDFEYFGIFTHFLIMIQDFFLLNNIVNITRNISVLWRSVQILMNQDQEKEKN